MNLRNSAIHLYSDLRIKNEIGNNNLTHNTKMLEKE